MTCKQLGGACNLEFNAETFEEIAELSKAHGMAMYQKQDAAHMQAMGEMQQLMQSPEAMQQWFSERQKEFETGIDIGLLNNRITASVTYYVKKVDDLILQAAKEPSSGFDSEFVNAGKLQNKGIEISLDATIAQSETFSWDAGINFFKNKSKITQLDIPAFNIGAFGATLGTFRIEEGQSATQIVGIGPNPGENGGRRVVIT